MIYEQTDVFLGSPLTDQQCYSNVLLHLQFIRKMWTKNTLTEPIKFKQSYSALSLVIVRGILSTKSLGKVRFFLSLRRITSTGSIFANSFLLILRMKTDYENKKTYLYTKYTLDSVLCQSNAVWANVTRKMAQTSRETMMIEYSLLIFCFRIIPSLSI